MSTRRSGGADPLPTTLLAALQSGEIDVETYIERKVLAATAHLRGLSEGQLRRIRDVLKAQIAEEPELQALVRTAADADRAPTHH